jgi:hypothetical protein
MYVSKKVFCIVSFSALFMFHATHSTIALTELKNISSCIPQEYTEVSPVFGALCYTYAKNLSCLGYTDSESVIMLHQLFGSKLCSSGTIPMSAMIIGHYLKASHIGQILGMVHLRQHNSIDDVQLIHQVKSVLKQITTCSFREIKDEIIHNLKQTIAQDNAHYLTLEDELLNSCTKEERKELRESIKSLAQIWNNERENLVVNKLNNNHQKSIVSSLKKLHKKIARNRSLLDLESKSTVIENPLFKDSMSAFVHGLVGSLKEEGILYPQHNTINLLLAFLWHKAHNKEELFDALQAYAKTIGCSPKICTDTKNVSYTDKDIKQLQAVSEDTVLTLPIEDIVYMHHICTHNQQNQNEPSSCAYMATYFNSFLRALQQQDNASTKNFMLPYLVALYAPDWQSINMLHPTIIYCRCMMQSLDDPHNRLTLIHDISHGCINTASMIDHYIHLLIQLYQSLPTTYDIQRKAFDILMHASMHPTQYTENIHLPKLLFHIIKNVHIQDTKAAIACTLLDYMQADKKDFVWHKDFNTRAYIISTLQSLKNDTLKALCIAHIAKLIIHKNFDAAFSDDITQCTQDILETIHDKDACYNIIESLITTAPESKEPQQLLKILYTWTIDKLDHVLDNTHKAAIFNQILAQYTTRIYPTNKHSKQLLTHITQKTLPSIHAEDAITRILDKTVPQLFEQHDTDNELYTILCDWIKEKLPTLQNEPKKIAVVKELIELSDKHTAQNKHQQTCIIATIERTLQSIHQIESKVSLIKYIVSHSPQSIAWKELYTAMYTWVERNIPDISDATIREDLLFQLLHRVQHTQQ